MQRKAICFALVLVMALGLIMGVQAAEGSVNGIQLTEDQSGLNIQQDTLLDLNGHHVTNATVAEGVTLQLMDSANDEYDASKCGSFSGTVNGTVEQVVKYDAKNYLVIEQDGVYSAHRFYAGITHISLVPEQAALGYKAEFHADAVINEMVTGYGYAMWLNSYNPVKYIKEGTIERNVLSLRVKNILRENNDEMNAIGAAAQIGGKAMIRFEVDGVELTLEGADYVTTLKDAVESVNASLGADRTAYTAEKVQAVRALLEKHSSYTNAWEQEYIFTEDKFAAVENVSVTYGDALTLGQVFTAVEGVEIGNVTATVNGEAIAVDANWADTVVNLSAGEAEITITDNDRCWTATNTVVIKKADPTYTVPTGLTATYGDQLSSVTLPTNFAWESTGTVGNAGVNTFYVTYTPDDTANYNVVTGIEVTVAVAKANPAYTVPTGLKATYGDDLSSVQLPAGFTWKSTGSVGNAGTNSFTAVYTPADIANYNTVEVTVTVEVAKADSSYEIPTGLTATYGDTLADVELPSGFAWKDSSASVGNAGTNSFTAIYTPADTVNYNTVEVTVSVAVAKANPTYTIPTGLTATYGQTLADVALPEGFSWNDSTASVGDAGINSFTAVYTPADTANYYTVEVTVSITVTRKNEDKFAVSLYEGEPAFLYRVGNSDAVKLGSLFKAVEGAQIGNVTVTVTKVDAASNVSGVYTANSTDWTAATLKFTGTGPVQLTIVDDDYCNPLTMSLEVVTGYNVTEYSQLKNRSSVLLNDITISDGGTYALSKATLYGNGFTVDATNAAYAATTNGYTNESYVISAQNAIIDNVQIIGAVYTQYGSTPKEDYNRALVLISGDSIIANSYLSNTASPVRVSGGTLEVINTTLKGGNYANLDIRNGNIVLDNVTTINQVNSNDTATDGTVVVGLGIVFFHEQVLETTTLEIRNGLTQYNYFSEDQAGKYMLDEKASALTKTMFKSDYAALQYTDADGVNWVNTGIISMCETVDDDNITDVDGYISMNPTLTGVTGFVHSCKPTGDAIAAEVPVYETAGQYSVSPAYSFDYTGKNYVAKIDGSNDYCYYANGAVMLSMDEGDSFAWDTSILTVTKNGQTLPYTVTMNGTDYTGKAITFNTAGNYIVTYTYTDSNNYGLDADGNVITYSKSYTKTVRIQVAAVKAAAKHAEFTFGSSNTASKVVTIGNDTYVMPNVTATSSTIGSKTVSGTTVYMPIINCAASNNKTSQTSGTTWYMLFPVFKNVVTITDYADGGTGAAVTYNSSTTTLPAGLSVVNPGSTFQYAASATAPTTPAVYSKVLYYTSPAMEGVNRDSYTIDAKYQYTDNAGTTYYYYVRYITPKITNSACVTADTLVTLADGSQKQIKDVTYSDQLLVWDFYNGQYAVAPAAIIFNMGTDNYNVIKLKFEDGTVVNVINNHRFLDKDLNAFVLINESNAVSYIGHSFVKQDGDSYKTVKLVDYTVEQQYTTSYSIMSAFHYNFIVEGMFSDTFHEEDAPLFDYFEIGDDMKYVQTAMEQDIATYGLYTYADFADYLTYEQFVAMNVQYMKVSVGKGMFTYEGILDLIETYLDN